MLAHELHDHALAVRRERRQRSERVARTAFLFGTSVLGRLLRVVPLNVISLGAAPFGTIPLGTISFGTISFNGISLNGISQPVSGGRRRINSLLARGYCNNQQPNDQHEQRARQQPTAHCLISWMRSEEHTSE